MTCEECKNSINRPCKSCGSCGNTPKVVQINNPAELVMFHKVIIPASMGDESVTPATNGLYKNSLVVYQANGHAFLYSSDGMPTRISFDSGAVLFVDVMPEVSQATTGYLYIDEQGSAAITMDNENWINIGGGTDDFELLRNRPKYAGELMDRYTDIPDVDKAVAAEAKLREQADNALSAEIAKEAKDRRDKDTDLQNQINNLNKGLGDEKTAREQADNSLSTSIQQETAARTAADTALGNRLTAAEKDIDDLESGYDDLNDKIEDEADTRAEQDGILAKSITDVDDKLNFSVVTDIALDPNTSTTVVKLNESKRNLKTGALSPEEVVLPVASTTQAGVMNAATFESIEEMSDDIASLLGGTVMSDKLIANPNQAQILAAWQLASGLTTPKNTASVWDSVNNKKYTYFANQNQWVLTQDGTGGGSVTVEQWTNTKAGIIKGSTNNGQVFAETDGTGSVNGWDGLKSTADTALSKATANETEIAKKEDKLPEGGTGTQYLRGDKTWQTLDKSAVGLGNVDNTSDANKPISTAVQNALDDKQDTLTAGANIQITGTVISATDTTYTAGTGISITNGVISNTQTSAEWGKITGTLADQTDLKAELDKKIEAEDPVDTEEIEAVVSTSMIQDAAVTPEKIDFRYINSIERVNAYLYKVSFNDIPANDGTDFALAGCSSHVKDGKLFRNLDWNYDNTISFHIFGKGFEGMSFLSGLTEGNLDTKKMEQLPYHIVDGINDSGIMMAVHVLYNDWSWTKASASADVPLNAVGLRVLQNVKSMATMESDLGNLLSSVKATEGMITSGYILQFIVTDGVTTKIITPPTANNQPYTIVDATANPKLTNFKWVADAEVVRTNLQTRPTGVERWNMLPFGMREMRFTKAYESPDRLSEFIGINGTTKASSDAELTAIYDLAKALYDRHVRDGQTWHTMHSVVYSRRGLEELYIQENWDRDYAEHNVAMIYSGTYEPTDDFGKDGDIFIQYTEE